MIRNFIFCALSSFLLVGCAAGTVSGSSEPAPAVALGAEADSAEHQGCDLCERGKAGENLWCDECKVGFVGGDQVKCQPCFQGKSGGTAWCDDCGKGFVKGEPAACKGCVQKANGEASDCGGDA